MFNNAARQIQTAAKVLRWIGIIASVAIGLIVMIEMEQGWLGFLIEVSGTFVSWISSLLLYGFGKLIENTDKLVKDSDKTVEKTDPMVVKTDKPVEKTDKSVENTDKLVDSIDPIIVKIDEPALQQQIPAPQETLVQVAEVKRSSSEIPTEVHSKPESKGLSYKLSKEGLSYIVSGMGACTDTDVVIPSTYNGIPVTGIDNGAFRRCSTLKSITIPSSVTSIGSQVFVGCAFLKNVIFEKGSRLVSIGDYAFGFCCDLKCITIPSNVASIGAEAFSWCYNLASIVIPASTQSIGKEAFTGCTRLFQVHYEGDEDQWNAIVKCKPNPELFKAKITYNYKGE